MTYSDPLYGVYTDDPITPVFIDPPFDPLCYISSTQYLTKTLNWATKFSLFPLPSSFTGHTTVRTTLAAGKPIAGRILDISLGVYQVDNQDPATFTPQTLSTEGINGKSAKTAIPAGADRRMYFAIDHNWNYQMGGTTHISISVMYLDTGFNGTTDTISLVYDGQSGTTTHATTFVLGNTKAWKQAVWSLTDAYLGGRLLTLNGSTFGDFYVTHPDTADLWISEVVVNQALSTDTTYFYLVSSNNPSNVQSQLTPKTLTSGGTVQAVTRLSATGSYNNGPLP